MIYAPLNVIQSNNFHKAWYLALREVLRNGIDITFGSAEEPKQARDSCQIIELTRDAIVQVENKEIHPQYPFKAVEYYCEQFTYEYFDKYVNKSEEEKFAYLYFQRLTYYDREFGSNQLECMQMGLKEQIKSGIKSNREQAITWIPFNHEFADTYSKTPPCLQRVWLSYCGNGLVDVHMDWRSRDLYNSFQANIIALVYMLNREVVKPNNCKIARIIDYSDSLHIYKADLEQAKKVEPVQSWSR
jgi:thymidylate synthase